MTMPSPTAAPQTTMAPSPTIAPTRPEPSLDDGDHERMTHIVLEGFRPKGGKDGKGGEGEYVAAGTNVVEGMVTGTPVRALCGKTWVPGRDPKRYPICPTCKEVAAGMGWKVPAR
jgi:Protein of unknown function (DUF3039)